MARDRLRVERNLRLISVDGSGPRGELRGKETKIYGDRTEVETRGSLVLGGKRERRARPTLKFW